MLFFDHCSSKDVDLVLKSSAMMKYESIGKMVERLGYRKTANPLRFEKILSGTAQKRSVNMLPKGA